MATSRQLAAGDVTTAVQALIATASPTFKALTLNVSTGEAPLQLHSLALDSDVVDFGAAYQAAAWSNGGAGANENYVDHVYALGLNVGQVGTRKTAGKTYAALHFESKFAQGDGGPYANEFFLHFIDSSDVVHRQLSCFLPHSGTAGTSGSIMSANIDKISWNDWGGTQRVLWGINDAGTSYGSMLNGFFFTFGTNNYVPHRQRNAANSAYLNLPYYGSDNRMLLDAPVAAVGATPTTGTYANIFARIQATTLPANGTVLSIIAPNVTGDTNIFGARGTSTGNVFGTVENQDNTNAASHAVLQLINGGTSAGDAKILLKNTGGTTWQFGSDNSVSDQLVWATAALGTGGADKMTLDTSGNLAAVGSISDAIARLQAMPRSTTAALAAIGNAINTANKFANKAVINTTTGLIVTAADATAAGVWQALDGTTAHTPV